jgi:UDP-N-acetylmuramoylalanine--D-glutamate ligase
MSRVLVVGLAKSGHSAALLLARQGHEVVAVDAAAVDAPELVAAGVDVIAPSDAAVPGVDLVVKSPGVPSDATPVAAARAAGITIISEVELAARHLQNPLIAVTGTNGKTTTTELTAHLLNDAGISALACGNQGTPLSGLVGEVDPARWLVVECSSFQLEDIDTFHPRAAVLLNVSPDHLDRHGDLDAYLAAKLRIFENQGPADLSVLPRGIAPTGRGRVGHVDDGAPAPAAVAWAEGGLHHADLGLVAPWNAVALRGRHNRQNAMAAVALAAHAGAGAADLARGLASFPGVEHRLEPVAEIGGVRYVNDSKATNPDAAIAALDAYPARVHLIAGGRAKGTPFTPLAAAACGVVVQAYLVGEASGEIADAFEGEGIAAERVATIAEAVAAAAGAARPGDVVLLAPACTSFDQYSSFEERGADFRAAVRGLPGAVPDNARFS